VIATSDALLTDVPSDRFTSLHWAHFNASANALIYADRAWDAWSLVQQQWPLIQATGFLKLACIGAHLREIRARASLKAAASGARPYLLRDWTHERLLRLAEKDARCIAQSTALSHATATAAAIRSGIAALQNDPGRRRALLESAGQGYEQAGMMLHRAAAHMQIDTCVWERGANAHSATGREMMTREGVRQPDRMSAFLMFA
jgi:hypothetical protein